MIYLLKLSSLSVPCLKNVQTLPIFFCLPKIIVQLLQFHSSSRSFVHLFHNRLVMPNAQLWGNSLLTFFSSEKLVIYFDFIVYLLTTFNPWQDLTSDHQSFLMFPCEDLQQSLLFSILLYSFVLLHPRLPSAFSVHASRSKRLPLALQK